MEMSAKTEEGAYVVRVEEARIDAPAAVGFKEALRRETADAPERIVLDLSGVAFIDSSGLGAIVAAMKVLAPDRRLVLAGLTPAVDKVFRLTRMDSVFEIHTKVEDAIDAQRV